MSLEHDLATMLTVQTISHSFTEMVNDMELEDIQPYREVDFQPCGKPLLQLLHSQELHRQTHLSLL